MSSTRYLDGDTIADAKNAYGCGIPLTVISGHLGCTVDELRRALDLRQWRSEPIQQPEPDLFSGLDRLESQL